MEGILACFEELWGGTPYLTTMAVKKIFEIFQVGSHRSKVFPFLGMSLKQNEDFSIVIDQNSFTQSMQPIIIDSGRLLDMDSKILPSEKKQPRRLMPY